MNVIILSKNRACQLDLLLRSIREYCGWLFEENIFVIYTYTSSYFQLAYDILKKDFGSSVEFIEETDIKLNILQNIQDKQFTMFLTDDCVFKSGFSLDDPEFKQFKTDDNIATLSLALGRNTTWAYEQQRELRMPASTIWTWRGQDIYWNYPMCTVGYIWRTEDILPKLRDLHYSKAWNIESALRDNPINRPFMMCYEESKVFEIPNNNVSEVPNKTRGDDPFDLNVRYINGERIKIPIVKNRCVHEEVNFEFFK
jgi:hypothetical protein